MPELVEIELGQRKAPPADRGELHAGGGSRCYTTILRVVTDLKHWVVMEVSLYGKEFCEIGYHGGGVAG
jgi:hypothetical protein